MAFTFIAPYPGYQTVTTLPNPSWGDGEGALAEVAMKRAIDGTTRTYVKDKGRRKLSWSFRVTRNKAMELREFVRSYHSSAIGVTDHNGRSWRGWILNNPLEITMEKRGNPARQGLPQGETCTVQVEFEGVLQSGDPRASRTFVVGAASEISVTQGVGPDTGLPNVPGLAYNWDATGITSNDGDRLASWPDAGPNNIPLIPRPASDVFGGIDPTLDMSPEYYDNIFGARPGVFFGAVSGTHVTTSAAMWSNTDSVSLFPSRRGTVFFVHQHATGGLPCQGVKWAQDSTEYGLWSMKVAGQALPTESFNVAGGASAFAPATLRSEPESGIPTCGDPGDLPHLVRGRPYVHMVQRDTDATMRWRVNGQEMLGRTIPNNPGSVGRFRLCQNSEGVTGYVSVLHGFFGHFLVYNRTLSTAQVAEVEAYLMHKWGVPSRLWEIEEELFPDFCITWPHWCGWNKTGSPYVGFETDCPGVQF
jgi:hypothetical protein